MLSRAVERVVKISSSLSLNIHINSAVILIQNHQIIVIKHWHGLKYFMFYPEGGSRVVQPTEQAERSFLTTGSSRHVNSVAHH